MLYSIQPFCSNPKCAYFDTVIKQFYGDKDVALLLFSPDVPKIKIILEVIFLNYHYPIFMLDNNIYGKQRKTTMDMRFKAFIDDIYPASTLKESVNALILFDEKMNVVLEGYYDSNTMQEIKSKISI
ncbi:MAG: hypothetical protein LBL74_05875 [Bacteroidales bacterium]|nr:hypothetical protein [Bacteroidales bacterium]